MGIGRRIREARIARNLTQEALAKAIGVTKGAVANYETDTSHPKEQILYRLFPVLGIDANFLFQDAASFDALSLQLSMEEQSLIRNFRRLSPYAQETLSYLIDRELHAPSQAASFASPADSQPASAGHEPLFASASAEPFAVLSGDGAQSRQDVQKTAVLHLYPFLNFSASAGAVAYSDDIPAEQIELPFFPGADFVIGVNGDSMAPDFTDGDLLYVEKTDRLRVGEVGIFSKEGSFLIKEVGRNRLISRNKDFPDVYPDSDAIMTVGRVLGKAEQ